MTLQLKNMISALFQSRAKDAGGTRCFKKNGVSFGWKSIKGLYQRAQDGWTGYKSTKTKRKP